MENRILPESLNDIYVANKSGDMVPLTAVMTLERRTAPQVVERYNVFPAAHIMGSPAPGYSSGQALNEMEKAASVVLSSDYQLGWVGSALQEKMASSDTTVIFVLALLPLRTIAGLRWTIWAAACGPASPSRSTSSPGRPCWCRPAWPFISPIPVWRR